MPNYIWQAQDRNEWEQVILVREMQIARPNDFSPCRAVDRQTN